MSEKLRISAKKLGELAMPDFCTRCFWIRSHMKGNPPFSIFPQIFGHIDRYTKRLVHAYFDQYGSAPPWLEKLGELTGYVDPPNSATFQMPLDDNVLLTGEADGIFQHKDGSLVVADYKTAFAKADDDPLYPIYKVQLNAYALLAAHCELGTVSALALVYTQPCTGEESAKMATNQRKDGFALGFRAEILNVPVDGKIVLKLAAKAWEIHSEPGCPASRVGCRDCAQMEEMKATSKRVFADYANLR